MTRGRAVSSGDISGGLYGLRTIRKAPSPFSPVPTTRGRAVATRELSGGTYGRAIGLYLRRVTRRYLRESYRAVPTTPVRTVPTRDISGSSCGLCAARKASSPFSGYVLSHYFFASPVPWSVLTKSERCQVSWLIRNHHGLQWEDGNVPYGLAQRAITTAVVGMKKKKKKNRLSCTLGLEKRKWPIY
ncbi:hypothetical protein EAG_10154 [Camponotus floridanus]|uniref:Uncharacterized protein n=1 Tax=Camponotus floridanus TaxID=104421 RepID=E2AMY5_CAMFO|nr:hypothetical protein EAG_10154 [Camponotus floridanus]